MEKYAFLIIVQEGTYIEAKEESNSEYQETHGCFACCE